MKYPILFGWDIKSFINFEKPVGKSKKKYATQKKSGIF